MAERLSGDFQPIATDNMAAWRLITSACCAVMTNALKNAHAMNSASRIDDRILPPPGRREEAKALIWMIFRCVKSRLCRTRFLKCRRIWKARNSCIAAKREDLSVNCRCYIGFVPTL